MIFMAIDVLFAIVAVVGPFAGLITVIIQIRRGKNNIATLVGLVLIINSLFFFFVVPKITRIVFDYGLRRTIKNFVPLIEALEGFKKKNGDYPNTVNSLVPAYLPNGFQNNICAFPKYTYTKTDKYGGVDSGGYYLQIFPSSNILTVIKNLTYYPSKNYPFCGNDLECKNIDDWMIKAQYLK